MVLLRRWFLICEFSLGGLMDAQSLINFGVENNVKVIIKEFK